jgi:serine/threonine protein phosphatase PrpC
MTQKRGAAGEHFVWGGRAAAARAALGWLRGRAFVALNLSVTACFGALYLSAWRPGSLQPLLWVLAVEAFVISLALLWAAADTAGGGMTDGEVKQRVVLRNVADIVTAARALTVQRSSAASCSVVGHRQENQDACAVYTFSVGEHEATLLVVCDGVGGEESGGRASAEAVKLFARLVPKLAAAGPELREPKTFRRLVEEHFGEMAEVFAQLAERESLFGLTTTVVAAVIYDDFVGYWWAGDSRAYLLRGRKLRLLTRDHSVPVERLDVNPLEVLDHEDKSKLTRGLHPAAAKPPDVGFETLAESDVIFLCSDGVWESCTHAELQGVVNYFLVSDLPLDRVCQYVLSALAVNTSDNSTIAAYRRVAAPQVQHLLSPGVLLTRGLREEFLESLYHVDGGAPPVSARMAGAAPNPPHTLTESNAASGDDDAGRVDPREGGRVAVCLSCNKTAVEGEACCPEPKHHIGFYLLLTTPDGRVSYQGLGEGERFVVGSEPGDSAVVLDDPLVAARHMEVRLGNGGGEVSFVDLETDNGTFLSISSHRARLRDLTATTLELGRSRLQLLHTSLLEGEPPPAAAEVPAGAGVKQTLSDER